MGGRFSSCCVAVAALAQVPPPPVDVVPATAEVVMVDVAVVDQDGRPVLDLARDEFVLREEGREQPISHFETVRGQELTDAPRAAAARPPVSSNTRAAGQRASALLAIVFDERHLRPEAVPAARDAVDALLARGVAPGGEIVLLGTGRGELWTARDELGCAALRARLAELRGLRPREADEDYISEGDALRIALYDDRPTLRRVAAQLQDTERAQGGLISSRDRNTRANRIDSPYESRARDLARRVWTQASQRGKTTLAALEGLAQVLEPQRGRKNAVLVTEGFVVDARTTEWKRTLEAARHANLVVHTLDARGLRWDALQSAETLRKSIAGGEALAIGEREASEGSDGLATETGGSTVRHTNRLDDALAGMAAEAGSYYLLGFQPGAPPDGKYRRLVVEVRRPGVTVRARKGYYALPARQADPASLPIPLRLTAFVREPRADGSTKVQVLGEIDPEAIRFEKEGDRMSAAVDWVADVFTPPAKTSARQPLRLQLKLNAEGRAAVRQTWVPVQAEFELPHGAHVARLFVRDERGGRSGSVEHVFDVPPPGALYVSAVLSDLSRGEGLPGPSPIARRTFAAGARLLCQFDVYNAAGAGSERRVAADLELRGAGAVLSRTDVSPASGADAGSLSRLVTISLAKTPPGLYQLALLVRDERAGTSAEALEPFEVVAATPPAR